MPEPILSYQTPPTLPHHASVLRALLARLAARAAQAERAEWAALVASVPPRPEPTTSTQDASRGRYLCERCFDAMTDTVLGASQSETGEEIAVCEGCAPRPVAEALSSFLPSLLWQPDPHAVGGREP